jgi:hypothetical protein
MKKVYLLLSIIFFSYVREKEEKKVFLKFLLSVFNFLSLSPNVGLAHGTNTFLLAEVKALK